MDGLTETDWLAGHVFSLGGSVKLRVWPPSDPGKVQSQWSALDLWIAMRQTSLDVAEGQKQKMRHFSLI